MYYTRDPPFVDSISRSASLSKCQGTRRFENANWYGNEDASLLICPFCFEEAVRGTDFALACPLQSIQLPATHHSSVRHAQEKSAQRFVSKRRWSRSSGLLSTESKCIYRSFLKDRSILADQRHKSELLNITGARGVFSKRTVI